jgi:hypothetical protein
MIMLDPNQIKLQQHISNSANNRARIHQRPHMELQKDNRKEQAQLIPDTDTGDYLNY